MRYLITCDVCMPFLTKWFDAENNFNKEVGMVVFDLLNQVYTTDGYNWENIQIDHL